MNSECSNCGEQHEDCECEPFIDVCCGAYLEGECCIFPHNSNSEEEE